MERTNVDDATVGRLRDRLTGGMFGGFGLLDLLGFLREVDIDRLKDLPDPKDSDDIQAWLQAITDAVGILPVDDTRIDRLKEGVAILSDMLQSDLFDVGYDFVLGLIEAALDEDEDEIDDGNVGGRRRRNINRELGLTKLKVARAVNALKREDPNWDNLTELAQRELILIRVTGKSIGELQAQVGEGRDWSAFFESFGDFLIKIQPFIELIAKLFFGMMI